MGKVLGSRARQASFVALKAFQLLYLPSSRSGLPLQLPAFLFAGQDVQADPDPSQEHLKALVTVTARALGLSTAQELGLRMGSAPETVK